MAQTLEFGYTAEQTLTATAAPDGTYPASPTAADSVSNKTGTTRYWAVFASNLAAGAYRLDYKIGGFPAGSEVYDLDGSGLFLPRTERALLYIQQHTDLISGATVTVQAPVTARGSVDEIIKGDDYYGERAFVWDVAEVAGYAPEDATAWFGGSLLDDDEEDSENRWRVEGSVEASETAGYWTLTFELDKTHTAELDAGRYLWSAAVHVGDMEITRVRSREPHHVLLIPKQT